MSDLKTLNAVLLEKSLLAGDISDLVNTFIRDNPDVLDIEILTQTTSFETRDGEVKEIHVSIKLIM